ncbi:Nitrogen assimilation transcription factor nit-4 [Colletotrichum karsti]|uniref:Nitrogen assimilation transcription factor nit-4 n=1 Tax=Colletotrichum karsti TaxID=1095194 RepID=A0A9P6HYP3_9PEZI|nr:Nitrogen assimilation transcription factor nit-4 [Colletotrichum karsti]KAF9872859.1 Nitrogen assimilation transcription factor nit-4 [Colletotrichum karsti]
MSEPPRIFSWAVDEKFQFTHLDTVNAFSAGGPGARVHAINDDGGIGEQVTEMFYVPTQDVPAVDKTRQAVLYGAHGFDVNVNRKGFVPHLGWDAIFMYDLAENGTVNLLSINLSPTPGDGPRNSLPSEDGRLLYIVCIAKPQCNQVEAELTSTYDADNGAHGIAFRMASDLGLQHSGQDISGIKGTSPLDAEVRRRLFWSCYFWDKAISLYTGRLPAVVELPPLGTLDNLDDSDEIKLWSPYHEDSLNLANLPPGQYPPARSHAVSCFINSCKLSIIINDIIFQVYSRRSRPITETALEDIKERLDIWRAQSPPHLRYDPERLPRICPPPHLISQNLLYFTTIILAHRPFWSVAGYYQECISAAKSIQKLLLLLESTFGLENITYLMGYCIYTGASAVLEEAKKGDDAANAVMKTFLRALNTGMRRCPLLERSLNIIIKGLKSAPIQPALRGDIDRTETPPLNSYIPAFPYLDPLGFNDMDSHNLEEASFDAMAMLDCFPELQTDIGELISTNLA